MSFVKDFERQESNDFYKASVCQQDDKEECQTIFDNYKLENAYPFDQTFPFDNTLDNRYIMIPKRVMQDKRGIKNLIFKNAQKQSCFRLDPIDRFSTTIYCENPRKNESSKIRIGKDEEINYDSVQDDIDINKRVFIILLSSIFVFLAFIFIFTTMKYTSEFINTNSNKNI